MTIEAILLGTAQDAGLPQAGCTCAQCRLARIDPAHRQWVASLGLVDHAARQSWLVDATPDFREQAHALHELAPGCPLAGILLTHAHTGHYTGLIDLGREAWNTQALPVYASAQMAHFLRANAPWSQLVTLGNIELRLLVPDQPVQLSPGLSVTSLQVPHRDEFSDTLAFVVRYRPPGVVGDTTQGVVGDTTQGVVGDTTQGVVGDTTPGTGRSLFYCPDIDGWDRWDRDVRMFLSDIDIALLDGTFFSAGKEPGRDLAEIPHPLATSTAGRLAGVDCDVTLIHLNHSNPLHHPGPEREWLAARGIGVGAFGARWRLGGPKTG